MTGLSKPVRRETATVVRGRALIVELHAGYMLIREKGKRNAVAVDYRAVLDLGYKLLSRQERSSGGRG